jgi:gluconolactonase
MQASPPYATEPVLTSFLGKPFNSVNDVVVHNDGSIWFTDPSYGHDQGYRPRPSLPNFVYRYDPATKSTRAMADGFGRPNGICFSPDQKTVYITDTDQVRGLSIDHTRASSM